MTRWWPLLAAAATLLAAAPAGALGVLPHDPAPYQGPGLAEATFVLRVRTDADVLHVETPGDPVGRAGLAPAGRSPNTTTPLEADPALPVPPASGSCWRGWCGVYRLSVHVLAPATEARTVPLEVTANGTTLAVPLPLEPTPVTPRARPAGGDVHVDAPRFRGLEAVRLQGPDRSWTARPLPDDGFAVDADRLPAGTELAPAVVLRNGTVVTGPSIETPPEPEEPPPSPVEGKPPDSRNASDPDPQGAGNATTPGAPAGDEADPEPPSAPAHVPARPIPGASLAAAALLLAARGTL